MKPIATVFCWLLLLLSAPGWAQEWHDHGAIRDAVAAKLRAKHRAGDDRVDVVVDQLDRRVRLAACAEPLNISLPYGRSQATRMTAEVRCSGPQPWKIYVPARLAIFHQVVVASRPLARGTILASDDIVLTEQAAGALGYGYLRKPEHAVGHELRRPVETGKALTPSMLVAPTLIKRGQRVNLEAGTGGIAVRMAGIARSNGIKGQIIEVENVNSGRLVQAVVRSAKSAEVLLE